MKAPSVQPRRQRWSRYYSTFVDVPPGPDWKDRIRAVFGAIGGIALTGVLCGIMLGSGLAHPLLVAPMGASAVLLFAVPASPLAQPWSIIGGNVVSALAGIVIAHLVPHMALAAALAVGLAILSMSLLRCLHPPGGAVALSTVLGGANGAAAHLGFAFVPVGLNCVLLVTAGWLFHRLSSGHSYPHRAHEAKSAHSTRDVPPLDRQGLSVADVDHALAAYGEVLDVSADDLHALFKDAELHAAARTADGLRCEDIMSRDILTVTDGAPVDEARALFLERRLLSLPVIDDAGRVQGLITPLDLHRNGALARDVASGALLARPNTPLADLYRPMSEGLRHEVVIVDEDRRLRGIVTQTDLIAALATSTALVH
jgi:CBS domain-containing membrane protein